MWKKYCNHIFAISPVLKFQARFDITLHSKIPFWLHKKIKLIRLRSPGNISEVLVTRQALIGYAKTNVILTSELKHNLTKNNLCLTNKRIRLLSIQFYAKIVFPARKLTQIKLAHFNPRSFINFGQYCNKHSCWFIHKWI